MIAQHYKIHYTTPLLIEILYPVSHSHFHQLVFDTSSYRNSAVNIFFIYLHIYYLVLKLYFMIQLHQFHLLIPQNSKVQLLLYNQHFQQKLLCPTQLTFSACFIYIQLFDIPFGISSGFTIALIPVHWSYIITTSRHLLVTIVLLWFQTQFSHHVMYVLLYYFNT